MPDSDLAVPDDLVQLRRRFQAANAAWAAAADRDAAHAAYEEAGRLAEEIQDHEWWGTVDDRFKARMALLAAARDTSPSP
jgi:hypothetical protein